MLLLHPLNVIFAIWAHGRPWLEHLKPLSASPATLELGLQLFQLQRLHNVIFVMLELGLSVLEPRLHLIVIAAMLVYIQRQDQHRVLVAMLVLGPLLLGLLSLRNVMLVMLVLGHPK